MKIGFACIYMLPPELSDKAKTKVEQSRWEKQYRLGDTTVKWLNENKHIAEDRLWEILDHNTKALARLVKIVASYPKAMRMVRFGSGVCPVYTHPDWSWFYQQPDVQKFLQSRLAKIGRFTKQNRIKISFHPGQFTVLASHDPDIIRRSIEEFEYHTDIARYLGYGRKKLDMKINVHLSGKAGASEFIKTYGKLTPEARNCITLENDEFGSGIDDILSLHDKVGIVLDIHHHWINTSGEYFQADDPRMQLIHDSWNGKRPTIHYSFSREEYTLGLKGLPRFDKLIKKAPRTKLRAHSMMYPNTKANDWALSFLPECDIMCEAKAKNLASASLYLRARTLGLVD